MDKNLFLTQLQELGTRVIALLQSGIGYAREQLLGFISEAMAYWTVSTMVWFILSLGASIFLALLASHSYRTYYKIRHYEDFKEGSLEYKSYEKLYRRDVESIWFVIGWLSGVIALIAFIVALAFLPEVLKVVFAPKLFLIEHIKGLL